jgi:hypothetical protein
MGYAGGAAAGASAGAAAAALAEAVKASGAIVKMNADDFNKILAKADKPLVVISRSGWKKKNYNYLTSYKGLIFYTKTSRALMLPGDADTIAAQKIWIPG